MVSFAHIFFLFSSSNCSGKFVHPSHLLSLTQASYSLCFKAKGQVRDCCRFSPMFFEEIGTEFSENEGGVKGHLEFFRKVIRFGSLTRPEEIHWYLFHCQRFNPLSNPRWNGRIPRGPSKPEGCEG